MCQHGDRAQSAAGQAALAAKDCSNAAAKAQDASPDVAQQARAEAQAAEMVAEAAAAEAAKHAARAAAQRAVKAEEGAAGNRHLTTFDETRSEEAAQWSKWRKAMRQLSRAAKGKQHRPKAPRDGGKA